MCPSDPSSNAPPTAPKRPTPPVSKAPKAAPKPEIATPAAQNTTLPATNTGLAFPLAEGEDPNKPSPIPPPSETLQYRAIGLVRGRYVPDVDQFTKGHMVTSDGTTVNTVLLGRVMSLLKKHVDLNVDHLWVVYPRTRAENLHMQIVGIWEPETLSKNAEDEETTPEGEAAEGTSAVEEPADAETNASAEASDDGEAEATATSDGDDAGESSDDSSESEGPKVIRLAKPARPAAPSKPAEPAPKPGKARPKAIPYHVPEDGFSIRGEVVLQSKDEHFVMVQIKQLPRPPKHKGKAFKLRLEGMLGDRAVGHFWDIQVMRKEDKLTILSGTPMGALPPQKRKKPSFGGRGGGRRPSGGHPSGRGDRSGAPRSEPRNVPRPAKPRPKVQE